MRNVIITVLAIIGIMQQLVCVGQTKSTTPINIIGCWQAVKHATASEETVFPANVRMSYRFNNDGNYTMNVSNGEDQKEQHGTFTLIGDALTLNGAGGAEPAVDTVNFLDGGALKWHVVLDGEKGTFDFKRVICKE